jgi:hypothetical protein
MKGRGPQHARGPQVVTTPAVLHSETLSMVELREQARRMSKTKQRSRKYRDPFLQANAAMTDKGLSCGLRNSSSQK